MQSDGLTPCMMRQVALKESFDSIVDGKEVLALLCFSFLHMNKNCTCSQTCTRRTCLVHVYQMSAKEALMMTKLRHPNIVQFFGTWEYMETPQSEVKL